MLELAFFIFGFAAGHYVSPWLDEKIAAFRQWISPQPVEDYEDWSHK